MHETEDDIRQLQELIDASFAAAGSHLLEIFRPPEHTLSARQLVTCFQGKRSIALATVTAGGEPRVAPVDAILLRGKFHFGTSARAARIRHLRKRPAVSLTYFEGDELAIIVHGKAVLIEYGHSDFRPVDDEFLAIYGGTPSMEEEGAVFARVEPNRVFTFAREPERYRHGGAVSADSDDALGV